MAAYRRFVTPRGDVTRVTVNVTSVSSFERGVATKWWCFRCPKVGRGEGVVTSHPTKALLPAPERDADTRHTNCTRRSLRMTTSSVYQVLPDI